MERLLELGSIVGAGAAGAAVAVLTVGGSLLLIIPTALIIGVVTLVATREPGRSKNRARSSG